WLAQRREPLVLVARSGLGTLNHTLLTVEALAARGLKPEALILVGPPHPSNAATLRGRVACPLFELPHLAPLSSETVRSWALASGLAQALA
ncbi:MAG: AAA family ATPase, partial [Planctomycetota bacterium]|nr:AAA family ATPase [Planctomycetota bacterium]